MAKNEKEISLVDLFYIFWSRKWLIALCVVIFTLVFFVKVMFFTADSYNSSGVLYVSNHMEGAVSSTYSIDLSDIDSSRSMAATCTELLNTRSYLQYVSNVTGGKYTWEEIGSMMTVAPVNETELLSVSVTAGSPDDAYNIASAIINKAPEQLGTIFISGDIEVIDEADYPELPVSRGVVKNTGIGFMAGLVVGCIIAFVLNMMDRAVHSSSDLTDRYDNIPYLGEIIH